MTRILAVTLVLLAASSVAKADTWRATGHTDFGYCATIGVVWCSDISYSLDITTGPRVFDFNQPIPNTSYLFITALSGEINGTSVSCISATSPSPPLCGDLLASKFTYFGPPVPDESIVFYDSGGGLASATLFDYPNTAIGRSNAVVRVAIGNSGAFTDWNIVSTPEPSTLLLLLAGSLVFLAGFLRRYLQRAWGGAC